MAMAERKADVVWRGDLQTGSGRLRVASGAFPELDVTFSARTGASDGKTSPEELIAAAHATCYSMAFSNLLKQEGAPPERLDVSAVCSLDRIEGALKITGMRLDVRGVVPGLESTRFQQLAETAEQRCPVSNALRNNVQVAVQAQLMQA